MDRDDDRDESIIEARITGTSTRALAKLHRCTSDEIEKAIDRRLDYEVDNRMRLRAVKLSAARLDELRKPFFEKAKQGDTQAGLLCVKIEERLAMLFALDQSPTARVDVYQIQQAEQPKSFEKIRQAIYRVARGPDWHPDDGNGAPREGGGAVAVLSDSDDERQAIE
jgi:hypothetical protein